MYRYAVIIHNPAARRAPRAGQAAALLRPAAERLDVWQTTGPGSATELARQASRQGAGLVVACGGDGTINEVVNGLAHSPVHMAVLPAGTANVLARELGLPRDPLLSARQLGELEPCRVALGRLDCVAPAPRFFLSMCGAGLDAHILDHVNLRLKARLGMGAYWLAAFDQLGGQFVAFQAEAAGRRYEGTFVLASRVSYYGGSLRITRRASLTSNRLQIAVFSGRSGPRYLRYLAAVLTSGVEGLPDVTLLEAERLDLTATAGVEVGCQVDGELAGRLPARIEIVPDALTLLAPPAYRRAHRPDG